MEDRVTSAQTRETLGFTRGSIIDANGHDLARTVDVRDKPVRRYVQMGASSWLGGQLPRGARGGLEKLYDKVLRPKPDAGIWSPLLDHLSGAPRRGDNVRLTIDDRVQQAATNALGNHLGAVVALNPSTGAILAMVSGPNCPARSATKRNATARCRNSPQRAPPNRVTTRHYAPGSIFKMVTLTAALDTGAFQLSDLFSGADAFGPSPYFDNIAYPSNVTRADLTTLTLEQALAFSDNFTFAHIGLTLGSRTFLKYAHRYGIGRRLPFDLPVAASTIARGKAQLSLSELAQASFGANVDQVTPLQMALVASAIGNVGILMRPFLVQDVESASGSAIRRSRPRVLRRVMRPATAAQIIKAMTFVVDHGSGLYAKIRGIAVAGKTGTADSGATLPDAWFISFAPAHHPVVAVAALEEYSGEGANFAAPIARQVMIAALRARGYRVAG